jgi:hypothetical protein
MQILNFALQSVLMDMTSCPEILHLVKAVLNPQLPAFIKIVIVLRNVKAQTVLGIPTISLDFMACVFLALKIVL